MIKIELGKGTFTKKDSVINYIITQIENYLKIHPLLKLIVGEAFEPDHWAQLFSLLKLKDIKKEKLTFNQLLDCEEILI